MEKFLLIVHAALLLLFGIILSSKFAGVTLSKWTFSMMMVLFALCLVLQFSVFAAAGEDAVRKSYPLLVHIPMLVMLLFVFHCRLPTALAAIASAYICCQPANWFGLLAESLSRNQSAALVVRIGMLLAVGMFAIRYLSAFIAKLYNKDGRSILIFSAIPLVYYMFDYMTVYYTDFWTTDNRLAIEFLTLFLCVIFMGFCVIYYKEYEQKAEIERQEQIVRIAVEQQARELVDMKERELETRLVRHDLRHLLDNLAMAIQQDDKEGALRMISGFTNQMQAPSLQRYCTFDTINYVLSNYAGKCKALGVDAQFTVALQTLTVDEALLAPILSNALENALHVQKQLPPAKRRITLMLKNSGDKLLFSLRNPYRNRPVFVDGIPVSKEEGHGYGTQSIRYLTDREGGKCHFSVQDDEFVLRVIL